MFWSLAQARVVISDWKEDYNHRGRHNALGYQAQLSTLQPAPTNERLSTYVTCFSRRWPFRTAGARWAGRPSPLRRQLFRRPVAIAAFLGRSDRFGQAIAEFAAAHADLNERDHQALVQSIADGELAAVEGV